MWASTAGLRSARHAKLQAAHWAVVSQFWVILVGVSKRSKRYSERCFQADITEDYPDVKGMNRAPLKSRSITVHSSSHCCPSVEQTLKENLDKCFLKVTFQSHQWCVKLHDLNIMLQFNTYNKIKSLGAAVRLKIQSVLHTQLSFDFYKVALWCLCPFWSLADKVTMNI